MQLKLRTCSYCKDSISLFVVNYNVCGRRLVEEAKNNDTFS